MYTLITAEQIARRIEELGETLSETYQGRPLTVVAVLSGSVIFVADLMRSISIPHRLGFVMASSYRGATTTGGQLSVEMGLRSEEHTLNSSHIPLSRMPSSA